MDFLTEDEIIALIQKCTHISADRKAELISIFKNASSESDVPTSVFEELQDAVAKEVKSLEDKLAKIDEEIANRKKEKKDLEAQNLPYIKKAAKAAVREMDKAMEDFTKEVTQIEDDAVKMIEKEKVSVDKSEVDSIRKKLGLGV